MQGTKHASTNAVPLAAALSRQTARFGVNRRGPRMCGAAAACAELQELGHGSLLRCESRTALVYQRKNTAWSAVAAVCDVLLCAWDNVK